MSVMLDEFSAKNIVGMEDVALCGCESHRRMRLEWVVSSAKRRSSVELRSGGSW